MIPGSSSVPVLPTEAPPCTASPALSQPEVRSHGRCVSSRPMHSRRRLPALLFLLFLTSLPGCITRSVTDTLVDSDTMKVYARYNSRLGEPVDRFYQQPASISSQRLARILSLLYIRTDEDGPDEQRTAIASDLIYPIANALSKALRNADSSQQIIVMAIRKSTHLVAFRRKYLTSLTSWVENDMIYIILSKVEFDLREVRKSRNKARQLPVPDPNEETMDFRTVPQYGLETAGRQGIKANWRDEYWSRVKTAERDGKGQIKRRTILQQSEIPGPVGVPKPATLPSSPSVLRELADLEEARQSGAITESQYQRRRKELMEQD